MDGNRVVLTGEHISVKVARWLTDRGFGIADTGGTALEGIEPIGVTGLGVLLGTKPLAKVQIMGKVILKDRRQYMGDIYFDARTGTTGKDWLMNVFGRPILDQMVQLACDLAQAFDVSIEVCLRTRGLRYESFWSDL